MSLASRYLAAYNAVSLALWAYVLFRALSLAPALYSQDRLHDLYDELLSPFLTGTQSLAVIEVVHAATGLVRASPVTTAIQVIGKNLVVWTVMVAFPEIIVGADGRGASGAWGFLGCVIFWGLSEVIRYGYFVVLLTTGDAPSLLKWLRYSAFIVLYPPGLFSEAYLVYLSLTTTDNVGLPYRIYLFLGFLSYIPATPSVAEV
ncbi:Very-long-chain (3R)-3-hydroxyacyl-CoA dehydratase [Paramyrothecium foliicola]|nr:Very-long-chain (3R)-3-hydroxyacyl-CoA dehydratase [Paramyrothecium foliicola]